MFGQLFASCVASCVASCIARRRRRAVCTKVSTLAQDLCSSVVVVVGVFRKYVREPSPPVPLSRQQLAPLTDSKRGYRAKRRRNCPATPRQRSAFVRGLSGICPVSSSQAALQVLSLGSARRKQLAPLTDSRKRVNRAKRRRNCPAVPRQRSAFVRGLFGICPVSSSQRSLMWKYTSTLRSQNPRPLLFAAPMADGVTGGLPLQLAGSSYGEHNPPLVRPLCAHP